MDLPQSKGSSTSDTAALHEAALKAMQSGAVDEAEQLLLQALESLGDLESPLERGGIKKSLAELLEQTGRIEEAAAKAEEALLICYLFAVHAPEIQAELEGLIGSLDIRLGRKEQGLSALKKSAKDLLALGDRTRQAKVLILLASQYLSGGELELARATLAEVRSGNGWVAPAATQLQRVLHEGILFNYAGELDSASLSFNDAIELARALGDRRTLAKALSNQGVVARRLGKLELAEACWLDALDANRALRNTRDEGVVLGNLASLHFDTGDYVRAERGFQSAIQKHKDASNDRSLALTLGNLARLYSKTDRLDAAVDVIHTAISKQLEIGDTRTAAASMSLLGDLSYRQGKITKSLGAYANAVAWAQAAGDRIKQVDFLCRRGRLYLLCNQTERATADYDTAVHLMDGDFNALAVAAYVLPLGIRLAIADGAFSTANGLFAKQLEVAKGNELMKLTTCSNAIKAMSYLISANVDHTHSGDTIYQGHAPSELEPLLRLALLDQLSTECPSKHAALSAGSPLLLEKLRTGTAGRQVPNWMEPLAEDWPAVE